MAKFDKVNKIHDYMPSLYNSRENPNWKALIQAIGDSDQEIADLIEAVRKQFFIKTASRPYIDRLGTANNVQRPKFVGMDDPSFRKFIPIMSYSPKQVKLILDKLLDLFFFKDSTTSFIQTSVSEPFFLKDSWQLEYTVDALNSEKIIFNQSEFTDINSISAKEIVSAINRQAQFSYAIPYEDSISKKTYIRIFTKTIGAKGSILLDGGLANISLKFDGFNYNSGNSSNTQWEVTIIGDVVTFKYISGDDPGLSYVNNSDIVLIDIAGNAGSFIITKVNASEKSFSFKGLFNTAGIFTQSSSDDLKFMSQFLSNVFTESRRALTWEVKPGEIIVEIPPSPPVVKRSRKGAAHINGTVGIVSSFTSNSIELNDASDFPDYGRIIIEPVNEIVTKKSDTEINYFSFNGRLISFQHEYSYYGKIGSTLQNILPELPFVSSFEEKTIISLNRISNEMTIILSEEHSYNVDEYAIIQGTTLDGAYKIIEIINSHTFKCLSYGNDTALLGGLCRVERIGLTANSKVILSTSSMENSMHGPYMWDMNSKYVVSAYTTILTSSIKAGTTNRNIQVEVNSLPNEGNIVFDFGTEKEEGPIRYFYKPSDNSIAIDPAYVFKFTHNIGSSVAKINRRGSIQFGGKGEELSPYVTDPSAAREVLKELMEQVKSVGVFLNFMVRYPEMYYSTIDVYRSGIDPDSNV